MCSFSIVLNTSFQCHILVFKTLLHYCMILIDSETCSWLKNSLTQTATVILVCSGWHTVKLVHVLSSIALSSRALLSGQFSRSWKLLPLHIITVILTSIKQSPGHGQYLQNPNGTFPIVLTLLNGCTVSITSRWSGDVMKRPCQKILMPYPTTMCGPRCCFPIAKT